ncbi:MAG TPA: hypothetical protein VGW77_16675 [Candidatus Binatia bacterium]|jgi:hypothetical protein|nr:hypothetical protein [Candidatus Binatia bacterium]
MNVFNKLTALKRALALAAVLSMSGTALAKNDNGGGVSGDLSPDRTSVTLTVTVGCDSTTEGLTGALSVYILQPSGRLLSIGIFNQTVNCTNPVSDQIIPVTVNAFSGLTFKPGPATLLIRFVTTNQTTLAPIVEETGSRVDLH